MPRSNGTVSSPPSLMTTLSPAGCGAGCVSCACGCAVCVAPLPGSEPELGPAATLLAGAGRLARFVRLAHSPRVRLAHSPRGAADRRWAGRSRHRRAPGCSRLAPRHRLRPRAAVFSRRSSWGADRCRAARRGIRQRQRRRVHQPSSGQTSARAGKARGLHPLATVSCQRSLETGQSRSKQTSHPILRKLTFSFQRSPCNPLQGTVLKRKCHGFRFELRRKHWPDQFDLSWLVFK